MRQIRISFAAIATLAWCGPGQAAAAAPVTTLYTFQGQPGAGTPSGPIAIDEQGNIFGTGVGGPNDTSVVYEVSPPAGGGTAWTEAILHAFPSERNFIIAGGVVRGAGGSLFGTATLDGGGCGKVYELKQDAAGWAFRLLYTFTDAPTQGCDPFGLLVTGADTVFGVTDQGGPANDGTVFELTPPTGHSAPDGSAGWTEHVLWAFDGRTDGAYPRSPVLRDHAGNLYGTSLTGGPNGDGTVWRLSPPTGGGTVWTRTVLWAFSGPDGADPAGHLALDGSGAIYGACYRGGDSPHKGDGVVFRLTPPASGGTAWTEATLWSFQGTGPNRGNLLDGVSLAANGSLVFVDGQRVAALRPPSSGQTGWTLHSLAILVNTDGSQTTPVLGAHGVLTGTSVGINGGFGTVWRTPQPPSHP